MSARRMVAAVLMGGLRLACIAPSLPAQAAADRLALRLFRDSLELSRDTLTLHRLEARTIDVARVRRDDPLLHLRLGFVALRIQELGGASERLEHAASEFEWATQLQPDWPYPWFGLGLAEARMPDRARGFAGGLFTMLGIDRDRRAGAAFARSIRADPAFVDGIQAFAETALSQRIDAPLGAALDALRQVQASPLGWDPGLLIERGRLERLAGSPDSARVAFGRAALLAPHPELACLELARTLVLTSDTVAASAGEPPPAELAYFRGAVSDDPEVVAAYRRDLQPIVADSLLAQFDSRRGSARVTWLREFWRDRAAADLRSVGDRVSEHLRRWAYVMQHFRLAPFRRNYRWGIEIYHSRDPDLDDRGVVWLRQGAPTVRIVWSRALARERLPPAVLAPARGLSVDTIVRARGDTQFRSRSLLPSPRQPAGSLILDPPVGESPSYGNETWRYVRPDGDLVLHFTAADDPDDYRLVESILQLDVAFDALAQQERELPGLAALLNSGPVTRAELMQEERLRGRRSIGAATTTNSWFRTYAVTMGGRAQWLAAGVRDSVPLVHVVYAVDAAILRILPGDRHTGLIPITVRAAFYDDHGHPVALLDTIQLMHRPASGATFVAARVEMPVPPGVHTMRLNVEAGPNVGTVYPIDTLSVPDVHGDVLAMSSVLIGVAGRALPWVVAPRDTAWLGARFSYSAHDTLSVFFEAYGLHPSIPYTVHLRLTRQRSALVRFFTGRRESVAFQERQLFPGPSAELRREISLQGLSPGIYQLEVAIEGDGSRQVRRRTLRVENERQ